MKVLFAASECDPFIKTGGLADVVGALPLALVRDNVDVRVVVPLYKGIAQKWLDMMTHKLFFYINLGWRRQYCGIKELRMNGVTYYFVDNEYYYNRSDVYGLGGDEAERYAFFCRAALEALPHLDFKPDIIHCHDWQTGMIPVLLKAQYKQMAFYEDMRTLYTIHNLQYQGVFSIDYVEDLLQLGWWAYTTEYLEFHGSANFMKGGIVFADEITTVSPTYAQEIHTAYFGERLEGLINARTDDLTGILNGISVEDYNPATDTMIAQQYAARSISKKAANKKALQESMGLAVEPDMPLIGMVGRLSVQKGLDLIETMLEDILGLGVQIAVLGKGDDKYVNLFNWAAWKHQGQFAAAIELNTPLAHRIYAGCDFFLMPSLFEPCGLSQMIAMRYGTIPIVRETGGLRDTVLSYNEFTDEGNGFTFFNFNAHDMLYTIKRAVAMYKGDKKTFARIQKRCMAGDYSWDKSAREYLRAYERLMKRGVADGGV